MIIILKELSDAGLNVGETILCHGAAKGTNVWMGPDGLTIDGQIDAQVQPFMRSEAVKVWNRKNHRISVSFRCRRDCQTVEAAERFIVEFYASCKRGGQLVLSAGALGSISQIKINNAAMPGVKLSHTGVLVLAEFTIVGGSIS